MLLGPGLDLEAGRLDARLCDAGRPQRRFLDTRVLPASGTYTILVDPQLADLGSMTLTLYDVPPDLTGSIAIGGPPASLTLGPVPGQNATLSFSGTAGSA